MLKIKNISFIAIIFVLFFSVVIYQKVIAYGGATVSWVAPTTDNGGGTLTGLSGYRVHYSASAIDCTAWNAANQATRQADAGTLLPSTYKNVSGGAVLQGVFGNTLLLTPGTTYNFAVVAYDSSGNLSDCATGAGGVTTVSKSVSYAGDLNTDNAVNTNDFTLFASDYGESICGPVNKADINNDCVVNINDFTLLAADYGQSF